MMVTSKLLLASIMVVATAPLLSVEAPRQATAGAAVVSESRKTVPDTERRSSKGGSARCERSQFKIAVDVGHTAEQWGSRSARFNKEYSFNLALAGRIQKALTDAGFEQTYLIIVHGKGWHQRDARVEQANQLGVNLVISVHHDDVDEKHYSPWTYLGETRHFNDIYSGYSIIVSRDNRYPVASLGFAKVLADELLVRGMHFTTYHMEQAPETLIDAERGIYNQNLDLLTKARSPAVVLEAGFIRNRSEEIALASPQRQDLIASAVLAATNQFCGEMQTSGALARRR
jgi:N-acetylmuramoyl-L-alanine amidase